MDADQLVAAEIQRAVQRVGKVRARQLMAEMRALAAAKAKARKEDQRTRFELGSLVVRCGLADWGRGEIAGMLLDGKRHAEESTTMRLAFRKRGESMLSPIGSELLH